MLMRRDARRRGGSRDDMESQVLIAQPVLHGVVTAFFATLAIVSCIGLLIGSYSRKETVVGEVVAREGFTAIASEKAGTVVAMPVKLGGRVEAGQLLAIVQIPRVVAGSGDTAKLTIERLGRMRDNLDFRDEALKAALSQAPGQIARVNRNADESIRAAAASRNSIVEQHAIASERLSAAETLARKGFASRTVMAQIQNTVLQTDQARANAELASSEIERARTDRVLAIGSEMRSLEQARLDVQNQKIQVETQIHDLQAQEFVRIVAPTAGEVRAVGVRPGQRVDPGDRLFALARPGSELAVALEVPSSAIGFIETGQRVVLKYDAFPFQAFGVRHGVVSFVQSASLQPKVEGLDAAGKSERKFSVEIRPDQSFVEAYGARRALKIGMGVTAEVTLERRRLVSWLLDPIYAVQGRLR